MLVGLLVDGVIVPALAMKPLLAYVAVGDTGAPFTFTTSVVAIGLTHVAEPATDVQTMV